MSRSLTAEFLLLALDDAGGKALIDGIKMKAGVAGAVLIDLALDGAVRLATSADTDVKAGRLVRTAQAVADPRLAEIADLAHGRKPKDFVSRVGGASAWKNRAGAVKDLVLTDLTAEGVLRHESAKLLGLFPTDIWLLEQPAVEQEVVERVRAVVVGGHDAEPRTAALVALCQAVDLLPKLFPDQPKRQLRARGKQIAEGDWGAAAVTAAIQEVQATVAAAVAATTAAVVAGSS